MVCKSRIEVLGLFLTNVFLDASASGTRPLSVQSSLQPARPSSSTDPAETNNLWGLVRDRMANTKCTSVDTFIGTKQRVGKWTADYKEIELAARRITITIETAPSTYQWLPSADPNAAQELGNLYLNPSPDFACEIRDWAIEYSFFDPPLPKLQWAIDLYMRFLPLQAQPPLSTKDPIKLRRQHQPYISLTSGNYVLLPPKDLLDDISSATSQKSAPKKKKKRVSTLPRLDMDMGFGPNDRSEGYIGTSQNPERHAID